MPCPIFEMCMPLNDTFSQFKHLICHLCCILNKILKFETSIIAFCFYSQFVQCPTFWNRFVYIYIIYIYIYIYIYLYIYIIIIYIFIFTIYYFIYRLLKFWQFNAYKKRLRDYNELLPGSVTSQTQINPAPGNMQRRGRGHAVLLYRRGREN